MSLSRNTLIYLFGGVVAAGGNVLLAPAYLRLLDAEGFGLWSRFLLQQQALQLLMTWGMVAAVTRLHVAADAAQRARLAGAGLVLVTALNAGVVALAGLAVMVGVPGVSAGAVLSLAAAALAGLLAAYPALLQGRCIAEGNALGHRSISLLGFVLQAALLGAVALAGIASAAAVVAAFLVAAALLAAVALARLLPHAAWQGLRAPLRELAAFGMPVVMYTFASQATDLTMRFALDARVGPALFGAFAAGALYASVLAMVGSSINLAWTPLFYRHAAAWLADGTYRDFTALVAAALAAFAVLLVVFSRALLGLYAGGAGALGTATIGLLVTAAWLNSVVWAAHANPLFEQKRSRTPMLIALAAAVPSLPAGLALVDRWGAAGAAAALLLNAALSCALAAFALRRAGIPRPASARLGAMLALLLVLSLPPLHAALDALGPGVAGWLARGAIVLAAIAGLAVLTWRSGLRALRTIELSAASR